MTAGERRLAERLEQKLDDDYLIWFDIPIGPKQSQADFVLIHPRRGVLVLETKDWRLETIQKVTRQYFELLVNNQVKVVINPLAQARHCAIQIVNELERDKALIQDDGPHCGKLAFPWGHGVVFTRITRKQFETAGLANVIDADHVICSDEMLEKTDPEQFQQRLWNMFSYSFGKVMTLPQIERVRWIMFPEIRVPLQPNLVGMESEVPELIRSMDLQQEQLARSIGDGHRVIHGVAGSGKTMILTYRAEHLAKNSLVGEKPILVLSFNEPLAVKLNADFAAKGLTNLVHVRNFHKWCRQQLVAFGQPVYQGDGMFERMVQDVIRAVDRKQIPSGQYRAVMIDEGHDFKPEWLKLITQMVDPLTNSLLVLYDDAQSIFERSKRKQFSFKSVGIQAAGRTTILRINYRNSKQVLEIANTFAAQIQQSDHQDEDVAPLLKPTSCGRNGQLPMIVRSTTLSGEAYKLAELLKVSHEQGHAWGDMAVLCTDYQSIDLCAKAFNQLHIPIQIRKRSGDFNPQLDQIKVMTMKVSKGLEFSIVALHGVGQMPIKGEDENEQARIFYVAATRATQHLIISVSGEGQFGQRLLNS
jgi:Nuclease-related domain/UvrD-like helicase C-terminal domain/AAA domain